ncbi:hypothetical protein [Bradyrhizobium japonicum]
MLDLLGERRLGGAIDLQVQGLRHARRSTLFFRVLGAFFLAQHIDILRAEEGEGE